MSQIQSHGRISWYLPSVLLVGVACTQLWVAHVTNLSPWAGGGFGMFSTTDVRGHRHLHAFALRPGLRRELEIPSSLHHDVQRILAFPSEGALRTLALALADLPTPDAGPLAAIEIQVWATHFAPDTLQPSGVLLQAIEVPIGARGS